MQKFLKVLPQYLVPQHAYTRLMGWLAEQTFSPLKNWMIKTFIKRYKVDMQSAVIEDPLHYKTFNDFFIRKLKPNLRPIVTGPDQIACPVDGCVSQMGIINDGILFQAKGFYYNLNQLLGGNEDDAKKFMNGEFATLYLAPRDYHRIHMPYSGTLRKTIYLPGTLFSVNSITTQTVPHLFSRNERLVCFFETDLGTMVIILVGAMIVGKISTVWDANPHAKTITTKIFSENIHIKKGEELGLFKLGSTVITLFEKDKVAWQPNLKSETHVQMGELLATGMTIKT